ncbi:uncharacterized protein LOC129572266 [Sitodiplosis mosellana]|uniref:uncharacterized protein LOC129572266 n=1 Tax=Sitodiplosis mosellana TaxID=263140 RepID=UPI002444FB36|nr:uncharacterized protein LOC129572266 [Sitodiplosis mosellana]
MKIKIEEKIIYRRCTRLMSRYLTQLNETPRIFNSKVVIEFNAELARMQFQRRPAARIARRHSVHVRRQPVDNEQPLLPQPPLPQSQPQPSRRYRRAQSVFEPNRKYIGPDDLTGVLNNLRESSSGVYRSSFHSVRNRKVVVSEQQTGTLPVANIHMIENNSGRMADIEEDVNDIMEPDDPHAVVAVVPDANIGPNDMTGPLNNLRDGSSGLHRSSFESVKSQDVIVPEQQVKTQPGDDIELFEYDSGRMADIEEDVNDIMEPDDPITVSAVVPDDNNIDPDNVTGPLNSLRDGLNGLHRSSFGSGKNREVVVSEQQIENDGDEIMGHDDSVAFVSDDNKENNDPSDRAKWLRDISKAEKKLNQMRENLGLTEPSQLPSYPAVNEFDDLRYDGSSEDSF